MRHERYTGTLPAGNKIDLARFWFEDLTDFITCVEAWPLKKNSTGNPPDEGWDKNMGFPMALKCAKHGWAEGAEKTNRKISQIVAQGEFTKSLFYFTDEPGQYDLADIGRALSGDNEYWFTERHEKGFGEPQFVRIVTNMTASSGVNAETLYNRALALACLVTLFERAEVHTEIWFATTSDGRQGKGMEAITKLKSYYEPLDAERIAFCIGHPAFFRRLGFVCDEMLQQPAYQDIWENISFNYGHPMPLTVETLEILTPDLVFGEMTSGGEIDWNNQTTVKRWLKTTLEKYGVAVTFTEQAQEAKPPYEPTPAPAPRPLPPPVRRRTYRKRRIF